MLRTLSLNPFIGVVIAAFLQTFLTFFQLLDLPAILARRRTASDPKSTNTAVPGIERFRVLGYGFYALFGIIFLDIAICWYLGAWSYADWRFQLPAVILLTILGLEYTIFPLFRKGSWLNITYFLAVGFIFTLFLHWWVPQDPVMGLRLKKDAPMVLGGLILLTLLLIGGPAFFHRKNANGIKTQAGFLWDFEEPLRKIFTIQLNVVIWALTLIQMMLTFWGMSLFFY